MHWVWNYYIFKSDTNLNELGVHTVNFVVGEGIVVSLERFSLERPKTKTKPVTYQMTTQPISNLSQTKTNVKGLLFYAEF